MLCWGEATCSEFAQYGVARERMVVTGWIRIWDRIGAPPGATGAFGVMLNGENGADSNCDLLQTANRISDELGLKFIVRLHPAFTSPRYASLVNDRCSSIGVIPTSEYVSRVEFSVAHMSGAAIEMLQIGSPVYLLDDGRLADAFKLPGLSVRGQDEVLAAVREDLTRADRGRYRTRRLKRWFNDDTDQERRILNAMLAEVM